ncbi:hypothetical protein HW452_05100 [Halomonas aquamarina]|uniref:Uncharacterized protein n=1 Tax=Vreelandella aquamarina TaxID=77097 RepID=A0ACC5VSN3_9GAMM|nr:hypothetical protein [Halomonas aquamarina]MBZ5486898.1 hypothetical protein [Halomonas aquamarina]
MAEDKIVLTGIEHVFELIKDSSINDIGNLDFSKWPNLHITIEGDKYHGTITPELAKSLYDFVYQLKRGYAEIKYGTSNLQRLRKKDEALFDSITFKISEGSSDVISKGLERIFEAIAQAIKDGFKDMTPRQKIATIGLVVLIGAGYFAFDSYLDHQHAQEMAQIGNEAQNSAYAHTERMAELVAEVSGAGARADQAISGFRRHVEEGHRNIVHSVSDADHINYSGQSLNEVDIQRITHEMPVTADSETFTEIVTVEQMKRFVSRQEVRVSFYAPHFDRQITIKYDMGYLGAKKENRLMEAFSDNVRKAVEIEYSAVFNDDNGDFIRGTLISIGDVYDSPADWSDDLEDLDDEVE